MLSLSHFRVKPSALLPLHGLLLLLVSNFGSHAAEMQSANNVGTSAAAAGDLPYKLNADFSLQNEVHHHESNELTKYERVTWQMRRYRLNPTFGILENKLLSHDVLEMEFGYPQANIIYGAFARKAMGRYPQYNREEFCRVMNQVKDQPFFVLKPISSGAGGGVLIMDQQKWKRDRWTVEKLANYAEKFLFRDWSDYGQRYEHVGVVVQERLVVPDEEKTKALASRGATRPVQQIIEIKVHVVFGELAGGRIEASPKLALPVDIAYCGGDIHFVPRYKAIRAQIAEKDFRRLEDILHPHTETIRSMGKSIAELYGADWFRLDVFVGRDGWLYINEVTYPSHVFHDDECTIPWLLSKYRTPESLQIMESTHFWQPILETINVTTVDFLGKADYQRMRHATDEEYEAQFWTVPPPEERIPPEGLIFMQAMVFCIVGVSFLSLRVRKQLLKVAKLIHQVGVAIPCLHCICCKVRKNANAAE